MIVKNEEHNIERALTWAKDIAFEQIVVDTGSTDRTVEIADKMGAKVLHFEWVNDFSAAKNYALEQATGEWIAFLDADEYFPAEDIEKLLAHIVKIHTDPILKSKHKIIGCSLYNITETGETTSVVEQARIYQNRKELRYVGKIHEAVSAYTYDVLWVSDIKIIHLTSSESRLAQGKDERNIKMIRAELAEDPQNLLMKGYLAEALLSTKNEAYREEAESLFTELIEKGGAQNIKTIALTRRAYNNLILKDMDDPEKRENSKKLCLNAMKDFPNWLDFEYFYTMLLNRMGEYEQALKVAIECEEKLAKEQFHAKSEIVSAKPHLLFAQILLAAQELRDIETVMKYAAYILSADKTNMGVLGPYISTLSKNGATTEEVIEALGKIYNMEDPRDLLTIGRAAKDYGAIAIAQIIVRMAGERMGKI